MDDSLENRILVDELAELEHKQWMEWSQNLAASEKLSKERIERWKKLWIPYQELSEQSKEQDRVWARRAIRIFLGGKPE